MIKLIKRLITFLFPTNCSLCQQLLFERYALCVGCEEALNRQKLRQNSLDYVGFDKFITIFYYQGQIKALIGSFKLGNRYNLKYYFASCLANVLKEYQEADYFLVMAPASNRESNFLVLVNTLTKQGIKINRVLTKTTKVEQKKLNREERLQAIKGKIRLNKYQQVPKKVLLLDDVLTTGATCSECVKVLRENGAEEVVVLVLAYDI